MLATALEELQSLSRHHEEPNVSIYLPVETAGRETRQNGVRLKNLLRRAEEDLVVQGYRRTEVKDFLQQGWRLEEDAGFWEEREPGLALYLAPGLFRSHWLPVAPEELITVAKRFHLKPLVELAGDDRAFYLLALSMNDARFFRCTRFSDQELTVEDLPRGMAEALWPDDPERQQQFRSQPVGQAGGKQGGFGVFHGSGDIVEDDTKNRVLRYFQQIDKALHKLLAKSKLPLVIAAVDYLQPIYREANSYRYLAPEGISGNPEGVHSEDLRQKAWSIIEPSLAESRRAVLGQFLDLTGTGKALFGIKEIVAAAASGRIGTLLYAAGIDVWGVVLDGDVAISREKQPGDEDLVDFAIVQTLVNSGEVMAFDRDELPDDSIMLAILRY